MTDYLHLLLQIFLILVQIAGGLSLVAWIVLLVLLKRGYEGMSLTQNLLMMKQKATIEGWVARDKNGHLNFFLGVPRKIVNTKNDEYWIGHARMKAPNGFFPSIKWEDAEPTKCKLTIEI